MATVVTGYTSDLRGWKCLNCGSAVIDRRLHDEWHQAVVDCGVAKLQKGSHG